LFFLYTILCEIARKIVHLQIIPGEGILTLMKQSLARILKIMVEFEATHFNFLLKCGLRP
jgi:hypothetical protein